MCGPIHPRYPDDVPRWVIRGGFFEPTASVSRLFDVTFTFETPDPRLKAGSSARVFIKGRQLDDALHVPRQAVFEKAGKNSVFVRAGDNFERREVRVLQRTEGRVAIDTKRAVAVPVTASAART